MVLIAIAEEKQQCDNKERMKKCESFSLLFSEWTYTTKLRIALRIVSFYKL